MCGRVAYSGDPGGRELLAGPMLSGDVFISVQVWPLELTWIRVTYKARVEVEVVGFWS